VEKRLAQGFARRRPEIHPAGRDVALTLRRQKQKRRPGMGPAGVSKEKAMRKHRSLLWKIVVTFDLKIKVTIIRK
jgi:hypothetical protein